ncbi:uncharacterized protein Z518_04614 [Rhinocladiella mackenziei CBS 650.93]|uniref:3-oxoacyl-[acyl-carrier-protein] reductase n=1 Tax=Rhinocladiella mackenziei CBS 650.93 TaxID=1442369 RepID=A0A0D2H886_9EURO|nr:uncharacterized protein Z518_04614 [Rhinocladiella mackenziei CBS 650.93]KIX06638.1 hypothetical protein Z518_04614 [Rhinocladiella mackenziei CBS 650.93]
MKGLEGRRILVAGGATGIGRAIAIRLAEEGSHVVVGDFNQPGVEQTVQDIQAKMSAVKIKAVFFDYSKPDTIRNLVKEAVDFLGGLDGLVNVGVLGGKALTMDVDIPDLDPESWQYIINGDLIGYAVAVQAALPYLKQSGKGSIVNTTSGSIFGGMPFMPAYQAAKAGVLALTKYVAQFHAAEGLRSNCVSPGPILSDAVKEKTPQSHIDGVVPTVPLRRWGQPDEIASLYAYLLSDDASYINGQTWSCCGGKYLRD